MRKNKRNNKRFLKLKMFLFKLNYIFIFIVFRPKKFFINKKSKKKYLKNKEPLIYTYNHVGYYDGLTLWCAFISRYIRFISLKEIVKNKFSKLFFDWNGLILIDRDVFLVNDYRTIKESIELGYSIGMAPESHINREMVLKPFQIGSAIFAMKMNTNILPVYFAPNRKIFFKRQHIFVGNIIEAKKYLDSKELTEEIRKETENLRFKYLFDKKSYVYIFPIDSNIKENEVRFDFFKKYSVKTHEYNSSKSAWYYFDIILKNKFGIILDPKEITFNKKGKPQHKEIFFNISHSGELVALIFSKDNCSIDIQKGITKEIKSWTRKEAKIKLNDTTNYNKIKSKKIKHNEESYYLSVIANSKVSYSNKLQ